MQGWKTFETWDETYVHSKLNPDIIVLQERVEGDHSEPWTWVRTQGKGRVFYTAYGHDEPVDERKLRDREVLRGRFERAAEAYRHADSDQQPADHHCAEAVRGTEYQRADSRHEHYAGGSAARPEVIEQYAAGNLRAGEAKEIEARQHAEIGCAQAGLTCDERSEAQIHTAEKIGNEVTE